MARWYIAQTEIHNFCADSEIRFHIEFRVWGLGVEGVGFRG